MNVRDQAHGFLREQLRDAAPSELTEVARFDDRPLEREGPFVVFSFAADLAGTGLQEYYVVAGQTVPNYYPHWNLTADEIYRVHLGTRFMLVLSVARCPIDSVPAGLDLATQQFLDSVAPGHQLTDVAVAAAFQVDDQLHVLYSLWIDSETVYVVGHDCPPGAYRRVDLPPHVVYRWHLGNVILHEAWQERRTSDD